MSEAKREITVEDRKTIRDQWNEKRAQNLTDIRRKDRMMVQAGPGGAQYILLYETFDHIHGWKNPGMAHRGSTWRVRIDGGEDLVDTGVL